MIGVNVFQQIEIHAFDLQVAAAGTAQLMQPQADQEIGDPRGDAEIDQGAAAVGAVGLIEGVLGKGETALGVVPVRGEIR